MKSVGDNHGNAIPNRELAFPVTGDLRKILQFHDLVAVSAR